MKGLRKIQTLVKNGNNTAEEIAKVLGNNADERLINALTALNKDTDLNCWFVCNYDHITGIMNSYKKGDWQLYTNTDRVNKTRCKAWHKASVKEIMEHFSK